MEGGSSAKKKTASSSLKDQAATAALYVTNAHKPKPSPLDASGKLSSASAATSLKYAEARDLPSFPSVGINQTKSPNEAATLANSSQKPFEHWKPDPSANANKAANLAKDYRMQELWRPEDSAAGSKAALLAARKGGSVEIWRPDATSVGNSAAGQAMAKKDLSPETDYGYTKDGHRRALMAATGAMSQKHEKGATEPGLIGLSEADASRIHKAAITNLDRKMYTSNPPVALEVEEKKRQAALRASAISMARQMYDVQQKALHSHAGVSHGDSRSAARHMHNRAPSALSDDTESPSAVAQYPGLQAAAQKLATERLAKLRDEHAEYRDYYVTQEKKKPSSLSQRLSMRGNRRGQRLRDESDSDSDEDRRDRRQAARIRSQMSSLNTGVAQVDASKQKTDQAALLAIAQRNVRRNLDSMDESVFQQTGKVPPNMAREWEEKARAKAEADSKERMVNHGKVAIGKDRYMDQSEIDAIALARVQPTLDQTTADAERRRAEDERRRQEEEARRTAEAEKKRDDHERGERSKEEWRKFKAEEKEEKRKAKEEQKARKVEEKHASMLEKMEAKQAKQQERERFQEQRRGVEEAENETKLAGTRTKEDGAEEAEREKKGHDLEEAKKANAEMLHLEAEKKGKEANEQTLQKLQEGELSAGAAAVPIAGEALVESAPSSPTTERAAGAVLPAAGTAPVDRSAANRSRASSSSLSSSTDSLSSDGAEGREQASPEQPRSEAPGSAGPTFEKDTHVPSPTQQPVQERIALPSAISEATPKLGQQVRKEDAEEAREHAPEKVMNSREKEKGRVTSWFKDKLGRNRSKSVNKEDEKESKLKKVLKPHDKADEKQPKREEQDVGEDKEKSGKTPAMVTGLVGAGAGAAIIDESREHQEDDTVPPTARAPPPVAEEAPTKSDDSLDAPITTGEVSTGTISETQRDPEERSQRAELADGGDSLYEATPTHETELQIVSSATTEPTVAGAVGVPQHTEATEEGAHITDPKSQIPDTAVAAATVHEGAQRSRSTSISSLSSDAPTKSGALAAATAVPVATVASDTRPGHETAPDEMQPVSPVTQPTSPTYAPEPRDSRAAAAAQTDVDVAKPTYIKYTIDNNPLSQLHDPAGMGYSGTGPQDYPKDSDAPYVTAAEQQNEPKEPVISDTIDTKPSSSLHDPAGMGYSGASPQDTSAVEPAAPRHSTDKNPAPGKLTAIVAHAPIVKHTVDTTPSAPLHDPVGMGYSGTGPHDAFVDPSTRTGKEEKESVWSKGMHFLGITPTHAPERAGTDPAEKDAAGAGDGGGGGGAARASADESAVAANEEEYEEARDTFDDSKMVSPSERFRNQDRAAGSPIRETRFREEL